jgi:DNA invertase Pin-like site-specific DNA recombinase
MSATVMSELASVLATLIVWKLDRLARSMKQLIEKIEKLRSGGIGFRSLTEAIDTTPAPGVLVLHMFS